MLDENEEKAISVSIIIVTYNCKGYIKSCIESIKTQNIPGNFQVEIIIVDNRSSDGTADFIRENYPSIRIIENESNMGYGAANNVGVKNSNGEYTVILNPDTILEENWLKELITPLKNHDKLITTPKVLLYDGSRINVCGLIIHFTGFGFTRGFEADADDFAIPEYVAGFSGSCFAVKRDYFMELGGFDDRIFLYGEDIELSWRAKLKGYETLFVPGSVVKHDYKLEVSPLKLYYLEKSRYMILRKYFHTTDLILISPSLLLAEILTLGYSIKFGFKGLKYKFMAIRDGVTVEISRVTGDRDALFKALDTEIPTKQLTYNELERYFKIFSNKFFKLNWGLMV